MQHARGGAGVGWLPAPPQSPLPFPVLPVLAYTHAPVSSCASFLSYQRWYPPAISPHSPSPAALCLDLKYLPVIPFDEGWKQTGEWFKANWLPKFNEAQKTGKGKRVGGIAKQSGERS
jgi:hypothetical protein